jgi:hypothetical protein
LDALDLDLITPLQALNELAKLKDTMRSRLDRNLT